MRAGRHVQVLRGAAALWLVLVLFGPQAARAQTLTRGPYLQMGTPTSMTVAWRTDVATDSKVTYGVSATSLTQSVVSTTQTTDHALTITGLTPGTRAYYAVGTTTQVLAGGTAAHHFTTSPPAGQAAKVRIWVAGDTRRNNIINSSKYAVAVADAMLAHCGDALPHLYLNPGDIADGGTDAEFTSMFFDVYKKVLRNTVCYPTMGNHDVEPSSGSAPYYQAYILPTKGEAGGTASGTESYYAVDYGPVHVIVLNSEAESTAAGQPMATWLAKDLAATTQPWIIAQWHHPPYAKAGHDSDTEAKMIRMREDILPVLEAGSVDLVFTGHSHVYERTYLVGYDTLAKKGKIKDAGDGQVLGKGAYYKDSSAGSSTAKAAVYVIAGHGGAEAHTPPQKKTPPEPDHPLSAYIENDHGSCLVTVDRNVLRLKNLRMDGTISDRFTIAKGPALVLASPDGGESLKPGTTHTIRWAAVKATVAQVKLELSLDGGATWSPITAAPVPNTGSTTWTVPQAVSRRAAVRVTSTSDATLYDDSDGWFTIGQMPSPQLVNKGAVWRYSDDGTDHGQAWLAASFDDSAWKSGPAELGYGDGDEATVLASSSSTPPNNRQSAYFRHKVTLPAAVSGATLEVVHDDGVAVWIGGTQVLARHVGNGTAYAAWASAGSAENETTTVTLTGAALAALKVGENVVAAMVKQVSPTSSDISFNLALTVTYVQARPVFQPIAAKTVAEGATLAFAVKATHPAGNPLAYAMTGAPSGAALDAKTGAFSWTPATGSKGTYNLTFTATDPVGQQATAPVTIDVTAPHTAGEPPPDRGTDHNGETPLAAGDHKPSPPPEESCGSCHTTGSAPAAGLLPALLLLLALRVGRRRRQPPGAARSDGHPSTPMPTKNNKSS